MASDGYRELRRETMYDTYEVALVVRDLAERVARLEGERLLLERLRAYPHIHVARVDQHSARVLFRRPGAEAPESDEDTQQALPPVYWVVNIFDDAGQVVVGKGAWLGEALEHALRRAGGEERWPFTA
jgi:hypothetical protein